ncbi:hypothetical protein L208DRAFT_1186029, partial [Tricholoma matsutake]
TGILHGLFPEDDYKLPQGWTHKDAVDVQSYFRVYQLLSNKGEKLNFSTNLKGNSTYLGHEFWNCFIGRKWDSWNVHTTILAELKEWDIHPLDILILENNINVPWPNADNYLPIILNSLAIKLFGEEAFPNNSLILRPVLQEAFWGIPQRSWNMICTQVVNMKTCPNKIGAIALAAFKGKDTAKLFHTIDNVKKAQDMLAELQTILEGVGAKIEKRVALKCRWIVNPAALQHLATEEDVSDVLNLYHKYFDQGVEDEEEPPILDVLPEQLMLNDCGSNFGMEEEAKMTPASLALSLGYQTGLPPSFNTVHDRSGLTPWDNPDLFSYTNIDALPDNLMKLCLHWHQLPGNHSFLVLVADEVGLGKTPQAITVMVFFMQTVFLQQTNKKLPRIL